MQMCQVVNYRLSGIAAADSLKAFKAVEMKMNGKQAGLKGGRA